MGEIWPIIFSLTITTSTEIVRDFLHAAKLRHGTDGFTSSPKEDTEDFFRPKNPTASAEFEPANSGTRGPTDSIARRSNRLCQHFSLLGTKFTSKLSV
jgi:hypothetical protein